MFKKLLEIFDDLLDRGSGSGKYNPLVKEIKEHAEYRKNGGTKEFHEWKSDRLKQQWAQHVKENNICEHMKSGKKSKWGYEICSKCGKEFDPNPDNPDKYDTLMG